MYPREEILSLDFVYAARAQKSPGARICTDDFTSDLKNSYIGEQF